MRRTRSAYAQNRRYFQQAYETGAHGWEAVEPSPYVAEHLRVVAQGAPGRRLLDLGCGEGRHCVLAAQMGFRAVGMDYEPGAIRRAQARVRELGLEGRVALLAGDVLALPFQAASADVMLDYGCLHHQRKADWPRYRAMLLRVLAPEGHFLLSVFSTAFRTYGPQKRPWHLAHGAYRRFFTEAELQALFGREFEFVRLEEERDDARGFWHALLRRKPA